VQRADTDTFARDNLGRGPLSPVPLSTTPQWPAPYEPFFGTVHPVSCGHVGCCSDSSLNRHDRAHFRAEGHPLIRSFEPGEDWRWCFVDLMTAI
jgi:hypothetical protein